MAENLPTYDLSVLAPPMEDGEALSSWLVRLAEAHLMTAGELQEVIGCPLTTFERGNLQGFDRVAAMTRLPSLPNEVIAPSDLLAHPMLPVPSLPAGWAVCQQCLQADVEASRAPHVRLRWQHPLATHCDVHRLPLAPHGNSKIKIVGPSTLWGEKKAPLVEPGDVLLETATFDDPTMLAHVRKHLSGRSKLGDMISFRSAVQDITAALAIQMDRDSASSVMCLFERPLFHRRSASGGRELDREWLARADAAKRLLYVRTALFILAEPLDPTAKDRKWPLASDWLMLRYGHRAPGWRSVFAHASLDPLFLMALELPQEAVSELGEKSLAWPADLRRRWTYAAAASAMSRVR